MTVEEALEIVDKTLAPERLSTVQELVFRQCWAGQTYQEIADRAGYDPDYVRVIGSRLWQTLSENLGERISKNNMQSVLRQQSRSGETATGLMDRSGGGAIAVSPTKPHKPLQDPLQNSSHVIQDMSQLTLERLEQETTATEQAAEPVAIALDHPGSSLAVDSPFYIQRPPIEADSCAELLKPGALIRIRAPERWGKTSLMDRTLSHAKQHHYQVVRLNFQQADGSVLESLDRFLRWFCANVAQQLGFKSRLDEHWDVDLGSKVSCTTYLQGYILEQVEQPLVIAIDEMQRLFEHAELAQDFLPMLRVWHEEAKNLPSWAKLRLIVVYSTELYLPLQVHQSPFNVGLPIQLPKFTLEQAYEFAQRHGLAMSLRLLEPLWQLVNGHPYLLHLAFYTMSRHQINIDQLLANAVKQDGIYRHHLRNYLTLFQTHPDLEQLFNQVIWTESPVAMEAIAAYKLESMGLVQLQGDRVAPSCELYRRYFREQMPRIH